MVWKNKAKNDTFFYGINFKMNEAAEDGLAAVINEMTVLQNINQAIPDTEFIYEDPYLYLKKYHI